MAAVRQQRVSILMSALNWACSCSRRQESCLTYGEVGVPQYLPTRQAFDLWLAVTVHGVATANLIQIENS